MLYLLLLIYYRLWYRVSRYRGHSIGGNVFLTICSRDIRYASSSYTYYYYYILCVLRSCILCTYMLYISYIFCALWTYSGVIKNGGRASPPRTVVDEIVRTRAKRNRQFICTVRALPFTRGVRVLRTTRVRHELVSLDQM